MSRKFNDFGHTKVCTRLLTVEEEGRSDCLVFTKKNRGVGGGTHRDHSSHTPRGVSGGRRRDETGSLEARKTTVSEDSCRRPDNGGSLSVPLTPNFPLSQCRYTE